MRNNPESWGRPDPDEEPTSLQDELKTPVEPGEDYQARTARRDLQGEASEADVLDQAAVAWQPGDDDEEEAGD